MTPNCLQCDYPRTGLADAAPCPECGTVPDPHVFMLRGWSSHGSPVTPMVIGAAMLCLGLATWSRAAWLNMQPAYVWLLLGFGVFTLSLLRWRDRERGGDREWVLDQEGVRVRGRVREQRISWSDIRLIRVQRLFLSRWVRIDVQFRTLVFAIDAPRMYVRQDRVDVAGFEQSARRWTAVNTASPRSAPPPAPPRRAGPPA